MFSWCLGKISPPLPRAVTLICVVALCSGWMFAGKLDDDLSRELKNKIVIFRDFPTEGRVEYDSHGNHVGRNSHGYWSSDSMVQIRAVSLKGTTLRLIGRRVLNLFDTKKGAFSNLVTKQEFEADLELDPAWQDLNSVEPLLSAVILRDARGLVDLVPDYWKPCVRGVHQVGKKWQCGERPAPTEAGKNTEAKAPFNGTTPTSTETVAPTGSKPDKDAAKSNAGEPPPGAAKTDATIVNSENVTAPEGSPEAAPRSSDVGKGLSAGIQPKWYKVGKDVVPPEAESTPDPIYNEIARKAKLHGTTVLWLVINPQGSPERIVIMKPIGAGLDDRAVEAVNRWKFKPATLNGRPVAVQINVEVNFRLY